MRAKLTSVVLSGLIFATFAAQAQTVIVESRSGGLNFASYSDSVAGGDRTWGASTVKSTAQGVTAGVGSRFAPFSGTTGIPSFTVIPPLTPGTTYIVEVTHTTAGNNCSPDIIVSVAQSGCTGLPTATDAFQAAKGNGTAWYPVGYVTTTIASPTITFTYASGTLAGTSGRFYADAVRFTPVTNPNLATWANNNSAWFTAGNWTPANVPGAGNSVQFGASPVSGTAGIGINQNDVTTSPGGLKHVGPIEVTSARNNLNLIIGNSSTTISGTLQFWGATINGVPNTVLRNNGSGTTTLVLQDFQGSGTKTMSYNFTTAGGPAIIDATKNIVITSVIIGSSSFTKIGAGTLTLAGNNTFVGPVVVNAGNLLVTGFITSASTLTVAGGLLSGSGTIGRQVFINAGGTISPGNGGIGTMLINNTLGLSGNTVMEIDRNGGLPVSDQVVGMSTVTYGGTLSVVNVGAPLQNGDTFTLFS
ncbi:MAG TPA: autotransporter-associated beta strand repeat-containing protein, partial [Candidatus Dormibacteraeota bacterium]|nr:autotransporter-associated beta strand repeat-containing protein [Candidatus Dormibacteraeota bacterium]